MFKKILASENYRLSKGGITVPKNFWGGTFLLPGKIWASLGKPSEKFMFCRLKLGWFENLEDSYEKKKRKADVIVGHSKRRLKAELVITVIGDHHRHRSEESFQVIWKFGTTSVPRVHRDESSSCRVQFYLTSLEHESLQLKMKASLLFVNSFWEQSTTTTLQSSDFANTIIDW